MFELNRNIWCRLVMATARCFSAVFAIVSSWIDPLAQGERREVWLSFLLHPGRVSANANATAPGLRHCSLAQRPRGTAADPPAI
ncbi:hypothetical protein SKAU_G00364200 [Synaphobranchus kaupii]|uniref:Uncharacterized protein n=1 Tax=Synaphobranchus kaupii TaxID=118154 RepID=A0A9Q1IF86_SYNKA|nr:hypothetical protein SKAU_G00364200 [Synaphobranchus kaupii]